MGGEDWLFLNCSLFEPIFGLLQSPFSRAVASREQFVEDFVDLIRRCMVTKSCRWDEGASCLSNLAKHGHLFVRTIGLNCRLMQEAAARCYGCATSVGCAALQLISAVLLRADPECVSNLVYNCELLEALARALPDCVEPVVCQAIEGALSFLFDAVFSFAEDSNSAGLRLLASLRSTLSKPIKAFREARIAEKPFDRIWSLYFDQASPSYFKVVHRKRLVRYAIPNELVSATDITDCLGSFLSLSQLPKELYLCSDEDFPMCCQVSGESKALGKSRKRGRQTEEG